MCFPTFTLWEVNVNVDLATKNLTRVTELRPFDQDHSPFASLSNNLTGPPLNGRAYNGVGFNLAAPDQYVLSRQAAIQLQLPAAIYQATLAKPVWLTRKPRQWCILRIVRPNLRVFRLFVHSTSY